MPRRKVSAIDGLLEEARTIEVLLSDLSPPSAQIERYWDISLALIGLVDRIEAAAGSEVADAEFGVLRGDLTALESQVFELDQLSESPE